MHELTKKLFGGFATFEIEETIVGWLEGKAKEICDFAASLELEKFHRDMRYPFWKKIDEILGLSEPSEPSSKDQWQPNVSSDTLDPNKIIPCKHICPLCGKPVQEGAHTCRKEPPKLPTECCMACVNGWLCGHIFKGTCKFQPSNLKSKE